MKTLVRNNCTGCHTPSYPLQHRFDEAGWTAIIELMKHVNVCGVYQGPSTKLNGILDIHEKELAAYLARARGPGESSMKVKLRPRPAGEAARVVFKEYDVPMEAELSMAPKHAERRQRLVAGHAVAPGGSLVHDAWADLDGNLWFTVNVPNHKVTIGRIDAKTGAVKMLKVPGANGLRRQHPRHDARSAGHHLVQRQYRPRQPRPARSQDRQDRRVRAARRHVADRRRHHRRLGRQGQIWLSSPDGALRFDPATETFTEFKSPITYKTANGTGLTYGLPATATATAGGPR